MTSSTKQTSLNEINHLRRWIWSECDRNDMDVRFIDDLPSACTSNNSLYIPTFNDKLTERDERKLRFFVRHELSHHIEGSDYMAALEDSGLTIKHPLGCLCNMIEDQRIERFASKRYVGDAAIISNGREIMGEDTLKHAITLTSNLKPDDLDDDTAKIQAAFVIADASQATWCPGASVHARESSELLADSFPNVKDYVNKLYKHGAIDKILALDSGVDSIELAKELYGLLWDKTPEEIEQELQKIRAEGEGDGEGEGDDKGTKGKGKKKGKPLTSRDGEPLPGEWDERTGKYRIPYEFYVKTQHEKIEPHDPSGHGLGLDYTGHVERSVWVPEDLRTMAVIDYKTNPAAFGGSLLSGLHSGNTTTAFANRMRRYLQVKSEAHYIGGKTKGNIHSRALYRAAMPTIGDGDWNRRVFRKKYEADLLDTSVLLLGDMSGSMHGPKVIHSTKAIMMVNHVISNVLRVPTEILTFSESGGTIIGVIKAFGSKASDDDILKRINDFTGRMWGNADADAINYGYDRLMRQNTKRKVMIVLSDGSPADGVGDTDPVYALRKIVKEIEASKKVDIIGIGIMDRNVQEFYSKHVLIKKADELEDALMKVITGSILSGGTF